MHNAFLKAYRVKWGTSSATRHLTGQQQCKTMASVNNLIKKDARCVLLPQNRKNQKIHDFRPKKRGGHFLTAPTSLKSSKWGGGVQTKN